MGKFQTRGLVLVMLVGAAIAASASILSPKEISTGIPQERVQECRWTLSTE